MKEDLKGLLKEQTEEIKRHNKVLQKDFTSQVKTIGEQYSSLNEKVDKLTKTVDGIKEMVAQNSVDIKL